MKEFDFVIKDPIGIHARPAERIVSVAKQYSSDIAVIRDGARADARKIFSLMTLGAKTGDCLTIQVEGADEEDAADRILEVLQDYL